ncbi:uncharacterized protein [Physcomitrium patens]|uniref:Transmembrane protein n=1 Tax=Physcomitrium patens TaxID=3218 RepID=A0A7I4FCX3_PHYPA|nr:uncharacterized protein LOC112273248 isoform X2 [Physcomitrium patens]|eukprot:XP_024357519.1 uncharacterized protein LOC112273248 isoform X2 [Physcomitrella patens]
MRLSGVATRVLIVVGWLGMLLALACGHHQLTQSAAMQSQSLQVNSAAASLEEGAPRESLKAHGAESEFVNQMKKMEFHKGLNTSYKRAEPIPQLRCLEGCDNYEPYLQPIADRVHRHFYTVGRNDTMEGWTASWFVVIGVVAYIINRNVQTFRSTTAEERGGLRAQVVRARTAWRVERSSSLCSN